MEFVGNQCPKRGPALSHTATPGPMGTLICRECGIMLTRQPPGNVPASATEASVEEKIRGLGLDPDIPQPLKDSERDKIMVEPKMITGRGPQGPLRGQEKTSEPAYGRMPFTVEDEKRLYFYTLMVRDIDKAEG